MSHFLFIIVMRLRMIFQSSLIYLNRIRIFGDWRQVGIIKVCTHCEVLLAVALLAGDSATVAHISVEH
jgi:hypothetical protein